MEYFIPMMKNALKHRLIHESRGNFTYSLIFALLAVFALQISCAQKLQTKPRKIGWEQKGTACWYGDKYHGRRTSSGEVFDMHKLTAAHPSLPFGTVVRVRNLSNGKEVLVRINDRGPTVRGRIIDLAYGAAKELDMVSAGLAEVELTVVETP